MAVKNIALAITLVVASTSLAPAQTHTRIGPAGVHRSAQVGLSQRPLAGAAIARRPYAAAHRYRRAYGPLISAPVGLYGAAAYQGYGGYPAQGAYESGMSYEDDTPPTPGPSGP